VLQQENLPRNANGIENLQFALTLDCVAEKACMSRRSFTRRFQQTNGESFSSRLLKQRITVAQRYLEKTDRPVDDIAERVGFPSTTSLRRHFNNLLNTSRSRYRREFRG
jgi:transcriptional regulator GlxA family with amidase domain